MLQATTVASQQLLTQQITLKGPAKCHTVYPVPIEVLSARNGATGTDAQTGVNIFDRAAHNKAIVF